MPLRKLTRDFCNRLFLGKADPNDKIKIFLRERADHWFERVIVGGLDVLETDAKFLFGFHRPVVSGGIEGLVVFAASIKHQTNFELGQGRRNESQRKPDDNQWKTRPIKSSHYDRMRPRLRRSPATADSQPNGIR